MERFKVSAHDSASLSYPFCKAYDKQYDYATDIMAQSAIDKMP